MVTIQNEMMIAVARNKFRTIICDATVIQSIHEGRLVCDLLVFNPGNANANSDGKVGSKRWNSQPAYF